MKKNISVKHKRGIKIESRIIVSAILLLLQLVILYAVVTRLSEQYFFFYTLLEILAAITVIFIVNKRGNPSYKINWIIFILAVPVFGISVYLLWGGGRVMPHFRKKMEKCESHYAKYLESDPQVFSRLQYNDYNHSRQAEYLVRESGYPLYDGTSVEFYSPGENFLPRFLEELSKAKNYIYIEFFIIGEGEMWDAIEEVIARKAKEGVEVRVLFDDFGSIKRQSKEFIKNLNKKGIKVAIFNKIRPSVDIFMNNRNHRKIVVIDGKVAVTGGINIGDEYINRIERFGYWLDSAIIVSGKAVKSFLAMFCITWEFTTGERINMENRISASVVPVNSFALPYADDPLTDKNPAEGIYMQMLNTAQKYVYITTPYLIIDSTMITALKIAARSGIDVRIITPHVPDKWYVHPVTQYNYLELLEAGVKIYEYTPGFIHSKIFLSDDSVATVGTVNMDYRSFLMHFECGVWFTDKNAVNEIKQNFEQTLSVSKEIKLTEWKKQPWYLKLKRAVLHIFAPFM